MAEDFFNQMAEGKAQAFLAGTQSAQSVNPAMLESEGVQLEEKRCNEEIRTAINSVTGLCRISGRLCHIAW